MSLIFVMEIQILVRQPVLKQHPVVRQNTFTSRVCNSRKHLFVANNSIIMNMSNSGN